MPLGPCPEWTGDLLTGVTFTNAAQYQVAPTFDGDEIDFTVEVVCTGAGSSGGAFEATLKIPGCGRWRLEMSGTNDAYSDAFTASLETTIGSTPLIELKTGSGGSSDPCTTSAMVTYGGHGSPYEGNFSCGDQIDIWFNVGPDSAGTLVFHAEKIPSV